MDTSSSEARHIVVVASNVVLSPSGHFILFGHCVALLAHNLCCSRRSLAESQIACSIFDRMCGSMLFELAGNQELWM